MTIDPAKCPPDTAGCVQAAPYFNNPTRLWELVGIRIAGVLAEENDFDEAEASLEENEDDYHNALRGAATWLSLQRVIDPATATAFDAHSLVETLMREAWDFYQRAHVRRAIGRIASELLQHQTLDHTQVRAAARCQRWGVDANDLMAQAVRKARVRPEPRVVRSKPSRT